MSDLVLFFIIYDIFDDVNKPVGMFTMIELKIHSLFM